VTDTTTPESFTFDEYLSGRPEVRSPEVRYRVPLPPTLAAKVPADHCAAHERLVGRLEDERQALDAAEQKLEQAQATDTERERKAIVAGKPPPKATADAAREHRDRAQHAVEVLGQELAASAAGMLATLGAADLTAARDEALARARELVEQVGPILEPVPPLLAEAGGLRGEAAWIIRLLHVGYARPWRPSPDALGELEGALGVLLATLEATLAGELEREQGYRTGGTVFHRRGPRREPRAAAVEGDAGGAG
jgi:hypothetical protein